MTFLRNTEHSTTNKLQKCYGDTNSGGQSAQLHYWSEIIGAPVQILLQYKWKFFSQILLQLKH